MKSLFKKLICRAVANDTVWAVLDKTLLQAARFADWQRQKSRPIPDDLLREDAQKTLFPDLTVRHGPFQGLKYPTGVPPTGRLFPKLIGSYEMELHPLLEAICRRPYAQVVNVGCGEGYYAVGLALRIPAARVFAYDPDPQARDLCARMAELNGVCARIAVGDRLDAEGLQQFRFTGRGLVLSDCEGYERDLFTADVAASLAQHDVLVEVHDFVDIRISGMLRERFHRTHTLDVIPGLHDIKRAQTCWFDELAEYDLATRRMLLAEERHAAMEWYYWTPRGT
jgi:hypothetical protein